MPASRCPLVDEKLRRLGRRVATAHALRSAATLVLVLIPFQLACFSLSFWPGLHTFGLRTGLTLFAILAAALAAGALVRWQRIRPRTRALAALYEQSYPDLGERLVSTVELSTTRQAHGSAAFIEQLTGVTEQRAALLDPAAVYSLRGAVRKAIVAGCLLFGVAALLAVSPRYGRFSQRFFGAWGTAYAGYVIEVTPGDAWVERGKSATIAARVIPVEEDESLPSDCYVVFRSDHGIDRQRVRMDPATPGSFLHSWPKVEGAISYHVEVGELTAGVYCIDVVDRVSVSDAPIVIVTRPPYVPQPPHGWQGIGPGSFSCTQFSRVELRWTSAGIPERSTLIVRDGYTGETVAELAVQQAPIQFILLTVEFRADKCGAFTGTLVVDSGHGMRHSYPVPGWTVCPDAPPQFTTPLHVRGVRRQTLYSAQHPVSPDEPLRIGAVVEDDEGIAEVALEYRINDGPTSSVPLVHAPGKTRIEIDHAWTIPKEAKHGDHVRFRLRATDNRVLRKDALRPGIPAVALTPQISTSPPESDGQDRWVELKVGTAADSLPRKEIVEQHDELRRLIEAVRQKLREEHALLQKLRQASHQLTTLSPTHVQQLAAAAGLNQEAAADLRQIAAKIDEVNELPGLADLFRAIAREELADAELAIERFKGSGRTPSDREKDAQAGESAVLQAMKKLDGLADLTAKLAQARLDRLQMERLAIEERELAKQAADLDPKDPKHAADLHELKAKQDRIAAELKALADKNESAREAIAQVEQQSQARKLADQAGQLARDQQAAMKQETGEENTALAKQLSDLAKKQDDLASRVHKQAAQSGQPSPPPFAEADQAATALRQAALSTAIERQAKTEADLAQWAAKVQKGGNPSSPSAGAKELAKKQGEIRSDLNKLADDFAEGRIDVKELVRRMNLLVGRQKTLAGDVRKLTAPKDDKSAGEALAAAKDASAAAAELLPTKETEAAAGKMDDAKLALELLARLLPESAPKAPSPEETKQREQQSKQINSLAAEQKHLREQTQKLAAEMSKSGAQGSAEKRLAQMKQLAEGTLRLSQKAAGPEAKQAAGQAAESAQQGRQAMEKAMAQKGKGNPSEAKAMEAEAQLKLEMTQKNLQNAADKMQPSSKPPSTPTERAAEAMAKGQKQIQAAQQKLGSQQGQASQSMQQAAKSMSEAAQQMGQGIGASIPKQPSRPNVGGGGGSLGTGKGVPPALAKQLEPFRGRPWGELPGELKTELIQSMRAQFGDDYAPIIQQYFEQIARSASGDKLRPPEKQR